MTNDLPDLLDLMTISVAAGLGLEQAMQVSCARFESPVCHELRLTLREMELGLSRHDALENMKLRTDIDDLVTFAVVLSQADALGLPIGRVLQAQADEMRDKRRQRAREKAAKVPVKILFPLALCFLPAIMIIVLGPIVGPDQARLPLSRLTHAGPVPPAPPGIVRSRVAAPVPQSGCDCRLRRKAYNDLGVSTAQRWGWSRTGAVLGRNEGENGKHSLDPVADREASPARAGRERARMDVLHARVGFRPFGLHHGAPGRERGGAGPHSREMTFTSSTTSSST